MSDDWDLDLEDVEAWEEDDEDTHVYDVYRDGFVHVQKHRCDTCIFHLPLGSKMRLVPGAVESMVKSCIEDQGVIPCHKRLDEPGQAVCRGFFDDDPLVPLPRRPRQ